MILTVAGCRSRTAADYFAREYYEECITLNEPGMMACGGKVYPIPPRMTIPRDQGTLDRAYRYFEDKEYRLYVCLEYPSECR